MEYIDRCICLLQVEARFPGWWKLWAMVRHPPIPLDFIFKCWAVGFVSVRGTGVDSSIVCCIYQLVSDSTLFSSWLCLPTVWHICLQLASVGTTPVFPTAHRSWGGRRLAQLGKRGGVGCIAWGSFLNCDSVDPGWLKAWLKQVYRPL